MLKKQFHDNHLKEKYIFQKFSKLRYISSNLSYFMSYLAYFQIVNKRQFPD